MRACGGTDVQEQPAGVTFAGDPVVALRLCLWSRVASRVVTRIATADADDADGLYALAASVPWRDHLGPGTPFAVEVGGHGPAVAHGLYARQRVKDAIVDQFRARGVARPDVDTRAGGLRVHVHQLQRSVAIGIDLAGHSLHRRGLPGEAAAGTGTQVLPANLAAGVLLRCGWPALAAAGGALVDAFCRHPGLLVEAAAMADDVAPGLGRRGWGFEYWLQHVPAHWRRLVDEADARRAAARDRPPVLLVGRVPDASHAVWASALHAAGLAARIRLDDGPLAALVAPQAGGLLAMWTAAALTDPVAGPHALVAFGELARARFGGWQAAVLCDGDDGAGGGLGLRVRRRNHLRHGSVALTLLRAPIPAVAAPAAPAAAVVRETADPGAGSPVVPVVAAIAAPDSGIDGFANRIRKNLRHYGRWARQQAVDCWRLYDADLPEFAFAIDLYHAAGDAGVAAGTRRVHVQEYAPPGGVDPVRAAHRRRALLDSLPALLDVPPAAISVKTRMRQRGTRQYQRAAATGDFFVVREGACRVWVNLADYLDTGLFLDHRPLRLQIGREVAGRRFLNLFAYTGTASVHAIAGGATATVSVDLSSTYLDWAARNFTLNLPEGPAGASARQAHRLIRADCREWLAGPARDHPPFDVILLDPPSFSNSARTDRDLDIQRDHVELIEAAAARLAPGGMLYFSNNLQRFRLDPGVVARWQVRDVSAQTIDVDFRRSPRIHRCWRITGTG